VTRIARLRWLAIVFSAWTLVNVVNALAIVVRSASGEVALADGWLLASVVSIPVWTLLTPPVFAISRRATLGRRTWPRAVALHLAGVAGVLVVDAFAMWIVYGVVVGTPLTFWQAIWKWSFLDAFFYATIVALEHALRYYRRSADLEAQLARAQLQALQMQIRPHFLFNTLHTISGLVRLDDKDAAIDMLAGLGEMLRTLLRSDGAQLVPVARELQVIRQYLAIEQVRFGDQLSVEVTVEPGLEGALIPNLILQPLVENAILHGITGSAAAGRVEVRVQRDGATLRMSVSDTGSAEPVATEPGIGISNTRARLENLYGPAHRFDLSHRDSGTSATIEIPLNIAASSS
jgi:two-component system LytT family sensor kinase